MKYFKLAAAFFKAGAIADMEYRLNLVMKVFTDVIWYMAQISLFEVIYKHTSQISGWELPQIRVFMGVLFVVDSFYMILFSENLDRFSDKVTKGELDMILSKPVNSLFMVSLKKMNTGYVVNIVITLSWLSWALSELPGGFDPLRVCWLLVLVPCGLTMTYCMKMFFTGLSLFFTGAENVNYVWYQLYRLGMRPDNIYPKWLKFVLLTFFPVGFIASVPAKIILGLSSSEYVFACVGIALLFLWIVQKYWRWALRSYSSASS